MVKDDDRPFGWRDLVMILVLIVVGFCLVKW